MFWGDLEGSGWFSPSPHTQATSRSPALLGLNKVECCWKAHLIQVLLWKNCNCLILIVHVYFIADRSIKPRKTYLWDYQITNSIKFYVFFRYGKRSKRSCLRTAWPHPGQERTVPSLQSCLLWDIWPAAASNNLRSCLQCHNFTYQTMSQATMRILVTMSTWPLNCLNQITARFND